MKEGTVAEGSIKYIKPAKATNKAPHCNLLSGSLFKTLWPIMVNCTAENKISAPVPVFKST